MEAQPVSPETSKRISILRFPLIIGVIVAHCRTSVIGLTDYPSHIDYGVGFAVQWFFSQIIGHVAVPLLFAISGYLFYSSRNTKTVAEKWIHRTRTLLWPYLLWNGLLIAVQVIGQALPGANSAFSEHAIKASDISLVRFADLFLGFDQGIANGPLWFLRDLITLSILAPAYRMGLDRTYGFLLLLPLAVWFGAFGPIYTNFPISAESVTWYGIGLAIASPNTILSKVNLDTEKRRLLWLIIPYLFLAGYEITQSVRGSNPFIVHKFNYILGAIIVWRIAGQANRIPVVSNILRHLAPGAFFVYLSHAPILHAIKEGLYLVIQPSNDGLLLAVYFLTAILTITAMIVLYLFLNRFTPNLLAIATGRSMPKPETPAQPTSAR